MAAKNKQTEANKPASEAANPEADKQAPAETASDAAETASDAAETPKTDIATRALTGMVGQTFNLAGMGFKIKEQVSVPVLKQRDGETIFVRFDGPVYQGEELKNSRGAGPKMAPARLAKVFNYASKMANVIIVNTVLEGELVKNYPENKYVGKSFAITMNAAEEGRRYKTFSLFEIEPEADAAAA